MAPVYFILIAALIFIAAFDALASLASRRYNINYGKMAIVSFIIYTTAGFAATRIAHQSAGIIIAACTGFFDATIGWKISMVLKANTGTYDNNPSVSKWITTAIVVTSISAILGLLGSELALNIH